MTNSHNKRDNNENTKAPNMPTNKIAEATSKGQSAKETSENDVAEESKKDSGLIC